MPKRPPPRRGPDSGPDNPGQVGRRPSSLSFLLLVAVMWLGVGVIVLTSMSADWHLIPGIFAIGIGLFFLKGAAASLVRRDVRRRGG
jgi:hypothetical protein